MERKKIATILASIALFGGIPILSKCAGKPNADQVKTTEPGTNLKDVYRAENAMKRDFEYSTIGGDEELSIVDAAK